MKEKQSENQGLDEEFELENGLKSEPTHTRTFMIGELTRLEGEFT